MLKENAMLRYLLLVAGLFISISHSTSTVNKLNVFNSDGSSSTRTNTATIATIEVNNELHKSDICHNILQILNARLELVLNGERGRQFTRAYRFGSDTIVSAHGISNQESNNTDYEIEQVEEIHDDRLEDIGNTSNCLLLWKPSSCQVFPEDMVSLDLVLSSTSKSRKSRMKAIDKPSVLKLFLRSMRLGFNFFPCISTAWLAMLSPSFRSKYWYKFLGNGISRSGPAFIKWGQWSSTRPDMFPAELCDVLTDLHADAPSHSWKFTKASVEESLSIPKGSLFKVFEQFDKKPIASGSIAQVHRAVLRTMKIPTDNHMNSLHDDSATSSTNTYPAETLAIKVRHPNVATLLDHDFRLMSILASMMEKIPSLSWLNIKASVEQFSHTMAAQADLDVEAHHLEILNHNFRNWKHIGFPKPIFANEKVIIETFEKGTIVTDIISSYDDLAKNKNNALRKEYEQKLGWNKDTVITLEESYKLIPLDVSKFLVTSGSSLYLKMMLEDGLMHADLHPGNILLHIQNEDSDEKKDSDRQQDVIIKGENNNKKKLSIVLVDAGMVAKLTPQESNNFIGMLVSLGEGDAVKASKCVLNFSSLEEGDENALNAEQKEAFTQDMIELFSRTCRGYGTNVDIGEVLRGVLNLIRIHKIRIDANYATLVVNALCLTAMAFKLVPDYNLLDASKPLFMAYSRLCSDGKCTDSKKRQSILKTWLPLLYARKNMIDDIFFKDQQQKRNAEFGLSVQNKSGLKRERVLELLKGASLLALSAQGVNTMKNRMMNSGENRDKRSQTGKWKMV